MHNIYFNKYNIQTAIFWIFCIGISCIILERYNIRKKRNAEVKYYL